MQKPVLGIYQKLVTSGSRTEYISHLEESVVLLWRGIEDKSGSGPILIYQLL